jgi:hypothetical protein
MFDPSEAFRRWSPLGTEGIVTEQAKPPVELDEQLDAAETWSSVKTIVRDTAKPAPVAMVLLPTIPLVGANARDWSTVNVAGSELTPSDAPMVCVPCGTAGIVTVQEKFPLASDVQLEAASVPPRVNVIVADASNPVPVALVMLPTIPTVGLSEYSATTVKLVDAFSSPSEAFIGCGPFGTPGIVTLHANPPVAFAEHTDAAGTESRVKSISARGAKPAPVAVVELPTIPLMGRTERLGLESNEKPPGVPRAEVLDSGVATTARRLTTSRAKVSIRIERIRCEPTFERCLETSPRREETSEAQRPPLRAATIRSPNSPRRRTNQSSDGPFAARAAGAAELLGPLSLSGLLPGDGRPVRDAI